MGTSGVYNKETGQLIGAYWKQDVDKGDAGFSVGVNYVADDKNGYLNPNKGGFMTDNSEASPGAAGLRRPSVGYCSRLPLRSVRQRQWSASWH